MLVTYGPSSGGGCEACPVGGPTSDVMSRATARRPTIIELVGHVLRARMVDKKPITTFQDLEVYRVSYQAMPDVFKHILPALPPEEKYDLADQLRRSTKRSTQPLDETSFATATIRR